MNAHLSNEDFMRYLAGEETGAIRTHLDECADCRGDAARLLALVGEGRARIQNASDRDLNFWARQRNAVRDTVSAPRASRPTWALAAALGVLVLLATFLSRTQQVRHEMKAERRVQQPALAPAISDDALLSAVNAALEQDVPSALAPLQQLAYEREQAEKNSNQPN